MKLDSKLKGGLAWAGLVVVLAVPAANVLMGKPIEQVKSVTTSDTAVIPTAAPAKQTLDPIKTASVDAKDPVKVYLDKGKKLPSYISDASAPASVPAATPTKPAVVANVPTKPAPVELARPATAAPETTASAPPVPLPRSARPKTTDVASISPSPAAPAADKPLILDDKQVAAAKDVEPFPMSDGGNDKVVGEDQLEEWDSGSLADYLERKGLVSDSADPEAQPADESQYEGWLVDNGRPARRQRDELWLF
jgi:hypothetical protein